MKNIISFVLFLMSFGIFAQSGDALNFDGTNDYVVLPNVNNPFNISSSHVKTVQVWFRNTLNQGQHVRIFSTGTANWTSGIWFGYAYGSNYLRFELCDGIIYPGVAITGTTVIRGDNQWHQATGVINGTVATLYLDATYQGSVNISSIGTMNPAGPVHVGDSYNNESASYFRGDVDELRVWERPLCQQEIMATMNCELTGSEGGLVAYYKFNNGTASGNNTGITNLQDYTFNANHGTLTNFSLNGPSSNWIAPGGVITGSLCPAVSPTICSQQTGISVLSPDNNLIKILSKEGQYEIRCEEVYINEICLSDITGKLIFRNSELKQNSFIIDLRSQDNGIYFISIRLNNAQRKTFKVVNQ